MRPLKKEYRTYLLVGVACTALVATIILALSAGEHPRESAQSNAGGQDSTAPAWAPWTGAGELGETEPLPGEEAAPEYADVDLVAARRAMPDNLYWKFASPLDPQQDAEALKQRRAEQKRINELYGRVNANVAPEEDIRSYYAFEKKKSEDYIQFMQYLLREYGEGLAPKTMQMLGLGIKMHKHKLERLPIDLQRSLDRRAEYKKGKEAWLAEKASQ